MSHTIFFEWTEHEKLIAEIEELEFGDVRFSQDTFNIKEAEGAEAISIFVNSKISDADLTHLAQNGMKTMAIRAAGFDMLNIELAKSLGVNIFRVASYSPRSIAEHVFALLLTLSRKLMVERRHHYQYRNVWTLDSLGFTLQGKTLGLFGAGKIGSEVSQIAAGFGMRVIFFDKYVEELQGAEKVDSLELLISESDVISIHVPLNDETRYAINTEVLAHLKPGSILINTSRGDVADSDALLAALYAGRLGGLGVDVWDSGKVDDKFDSRLLRDDVIQTHHVGFYTREAVTEILRQTLGNLSGKADPKNVL